MTRYEPSPGRGCARSDNLVHRIWDDDMDPSRARVLRIEACGQSKDTGVK